ncbi:MAG: heparinase II/III family protein [Gemmatimonadota bacterium]|nr:heparinase II/III family protein [Gemmatimonadota bacterium]
MSELPRNIEQFTDRDFLIEFDGSSAELRRATTLAEKGDLNAARTALVNHFRNRQTPRWPFDLRDGRNGEMGHLWPPVLKPDIEDFKERADLALRNILVMSPGLELRFGRDLDWVTPDTISLFVPGNTFKCCHFMRDLAIAHAASREGAYAEKFAEFAARWVTDWPFRLDPDFTGEDIVFCRSTGEKSMPSGHRLFNWITCIQSGILFAREVPVETAFALIKAMWYTCASYVHFEESRYARNNHHIMRTCNVPAVMAMYFPETPRLQRLLTLARRNLKRHAAGSFLSDGCYVERSGSYAMVTLEMFLAPLLIAKLNRVRLMDAADSAVIRRAIEQIALTVLPSGQLPPVGDGAPPGASATAGLLGLACFALDSAICAEVLHRMGLNGHLPSLLQAPPPKPPASLPSAVRLPATGIAVLRGSWKPDAAAITLNVPDGECDVTGHAHDDSLAVTFLARGAPILWLPSNELYVHVNGPRYRGKPERGYPYSDLSKSVVLLHGRPRSRPEAMADVWGVAAASVESSLQAGAESVLTGTLTTADGVTWSREIRLGPDDEWALTDSVRSKSRKFHRALFHFDYGVEVSGSGAGFRAVRGDAAVGIDFVSNRLGKTRLRRNVSWLRPNAHRRGQPAPWLLEVPFGGSGEAVLETRFSIEGR